ncbi:MAG: hypothetical protein A3K53_09760 [Deltaproteobacteria bacterium RIFOXYB2_FULL_66_7]|nr:MAG: hypothetical protein A3K53_09760 [Deltaproteobacteria bacterium RIFOXYB2_FULL_66_7]
MVSGGVGESEPATVDRPGQVADQQWFFPWIGLEKDGSNAVRETGLIVPFRMLGQDVGVVVLHEVVAKCRQINQDGEKRQ